MAREGLVSGWWLRIRPLWLRRFVGSLLPPVRVRIPSGYRPLGLLSEEPEDRCRVLDGARVQMAGHASPEAVAAIREVVAAARAHMEARAFAMRYVTRGHSAWPGSPEDRLRDLIRYGRGVARCDCDSGLCEGWAMTYRDDDEPGVPLADLFPELVAGQ